MFDEVFRGFDLAPFGSERVFDRLTPGWPSLEVSETDQEVRVSADLAGLEDKDVRVELANGVLAISGEKKTETEDRDRLFTERYYGRFERRVPVENVDENKVSASFKNGVLTVTLAKAPQAQCEAHRSERQIIEHGSERALATNIPRRRRTPGVKVHFCRGNNNRWYFPQRRRRR